MRHSVGAREGGVPRPGRRSLLRGLAGGLAVTATAGAAGCRSEPADVDGSPVRVERGTLSAAGFTDAAWALARPEGEETVPLCLALHGQGGDHGMIIGAGGLELEDVLAGLLDEGAAPFAVAAIDGGDTYWHPREDGTDSGALVMKHLIPAVEEHGVDASTLGFIGWSMGGYGSLRLAGELGPSRVAAVAAVSPALWESWREVPDVAFDDEEDYEEHRVTGRQRDLRGIPVRIDCGESDFFYEAARDYAEGFESVETHFGPGDHTMDYWGEVAPAQLGWLGRHLTG